MEHLCPDIGRLVSCHTCNSQSLPPYQLCWASHVICPPCAKYLQRCVCGSRVNPNSNMTFDWLVSSLALRCKYRPEPGNKYASGSGGDGDVVVDGNDCGHENRWFAVKDLHEHYRSECAYNLFKCPLDGCDHLARMETIAEHYESVHGPFDVLEPKCSRFSVVTAIIKLSSMGRAQIVRKFFNGYFLFNVTPRKLQKNERDTVGPHFSMQNINPADVLRYTYNVNIRPKEITITVTIMEPPLYFSN